MTYLIDSHALVWYRQGNAQISEEIQTLLSDPDQTVFYSVVTPWELYIKYAKGKLKLPESFFDTLPQSGFVALPVEEKHIAALRKLPNLHGDPFDRMLVAQTLVERMTLITADKKLAA